MELSATQLEEFRARHEQSAVWLDQQAGTLLLNADSNKLRNAVHKGWKGYPGERVYSALRPSSFGKREEWEPTLKSFYEAASKNAQEPLAVPLRQTVDVLRQALLEGSCEGAKAALATLGGRMFRLLSAPMDPHHPADNSARMLRSAAREVLIDCTRIWRAVHHTESTHIQGGKEGKIEAAKQLLMICNWIEASIYQVPQAHNNVVGVRSIRSAAQEADLQRTIRKTATTLTPHQARLYSYLSRAVYAAPNDETRTRIKKVIDETFRRQPGPVANIRRHLCGVPAPETDAKAAKLTTLITERARAGALNTWQPAVGWRNRPLGLPKQWRAHELWKNEAPTFLKEFERAAETCGTAPGVERFLTLLDSRKEEQESWLQALTGPGSSLRERSSCANNILRLTETIDGALKKILGKYPQSGREEAFLRVLKAFENAAEPLFDILASQLPSDSCLHRRLAEIRQWRANATHGLKPSSGFIVSEGYLLRTTYQSSLYSSRPETLADRHTLVHQSVRGAIGALMGRGSTLKELGRKGRYEQINMRVTDSGFIRGEGCGNYAPLALTGIEGFDDRLRIFYSAPLRDHGIRLCIAEAEKGCVEFIVGFDGANENQRYARAKRYFEIVTNELGLRAKRKVGAQHWPQIETKPRQAFAWTASVHSEQRLNKALDVLSAIMRGCVTITYFKNPTERFLNDAFRPHCTAGKLNSLVLNCTSCYPHFKLIGEVGRSVGARFGQRAIVESEGALTYVQDFNDEHRPKMAGRYETKSMSYFSTGPAKKFPPGIGGIERAQPIV